MTTCPLCGKPCETAEFFGGAVRVCPCVPNPPGIVAVDASKIGRGIGAKVLAEPIETETAAMHASMDRKEAELDAHGYGGAGIASHLALEEGPPMPPTRAGKLHALLVEAGEGLEYHPTSPPRAGDTARLAHEAAKAWDDIRADIDALKAILGKPTTYVRPANERPPREDYVRVTVSRQGWTIEPAVEHRRGDKFDFLADQLSTIAEATFLRDDDDQMLAAKIIGGVIAMEFPDRAYFVEVWQEGKRGFAQVFQPFGVPRTRG